MRLVVVASLLITGLAGCTETPAEEPEEIVAEDCVTAGLCAQDPLIVDGRDLRTDLWANDTLDAPVWNIGDVFEQHLYFGERDNAGSHIQTMVIQNQGGYVLATSDRESARNEAMYDYPILGDIGTNLETTFFGSDFDMYDWPLSDGKTWSRTIEGLLNWNSYSFTEFELTMTATFNDAIDTPKGDFPGFDINGVTAEGDVLVTYNYVPAIGWFSHLWMWDLETSDADDVMFHAMSMGTSVDYDGPYYVSEANEVLDEFYGVFPGGPPQGNPVHDFTMPEADHMMGILVLIAVGGRTEIQLQDPGGSAVSWEYQQLDQNGPGFEVVFFEDEGQAGAWQSRVVGAGLATGGYVWLSAVDTAEYEM